MKRKRKVDGPSLSADLLSVLATKEFHMQEGHEAMLGYQIMQLAKEHQWGDEQLQPVLIHLLRRLGRPEVAQQVVDNGWTMEKFMMSYAHPLGNKADMATIQAFRSHSQQIRELQRQYQAQQDAMVQRAMETQHVALVDMDDWLLPGLPGGPALTDAARANLEWRQAFAWTPLNQSAMTEAWRAHALASDVEDEAPASSSSGSATSSSSAAAAASSSSSSSSAAASASSSSALCTSKLMSFLERIESI